MSLELVQPIIIGPWWSWRSRCSSCASRWQPNDASGAALLGVAIGVYLGATADERFAGDPVEYRVVVPGDGAALVADLRARGWPVTVQTAEGLRGPATLLFVAVEGRARRGRRLRPRPARPRGLPNQQPAAFGGVGAAPTWLPERRSRSDVDEEGHQRQPTRRRRGSGRSGGRCGCEQRSSIGSAEERQERLRNTATCTIAVMTTTETTANVQPSGGLS